MTTTPDTLAKLAADNLPERIYLVLGEDIAPDDDPRADFDDLADVTWCIDKQFDNDVEYVRADVAALTAQALPAAEPWNAQPFNAPVYPPDGTKSPFTVINLGLGKVQMGDSIHDHRLPALWFGTNGQGMGHEEIMNREAKPGETLAVVTFANVEGLDVLLEAVQRIRRESFPQAAQQAAQATAGWLPIGLAPKDGTNIWAFNGEQGVMHWIDVDVTALWVWEDDLLSDADPEPIQPTHWQPLPAPPDALPQPQPQSAQAKGDA